jgi:hypothetical protein
VIFLDLAAPLCLWRVGKRLIRDRRRRRPDLPDGCRESFDPAGLRWIWGNRRHDRPRLLGQLASLHGVDVRRLTTRAEVRRFLTRLRQTDTHHDESRSWLRCRPICAHGFLTSECPVQGVSKTKAFETLGSGHRSTFRTPASCPPSDRAYRRVWLVPVALGPYAQLIASTRPSETA